MSETKSKKFITCGLYTIRNIKETFFDKSKMVLRMKVHNM